MGATHFLTRTLPRVSTEMSLHVLAYNLKPVIKLLGIDALIDAIRACALYLLSIRGHFSRLASVLRVYFKKAHYRLAFDESPAQHA